MAAADTLDTAAPDTPSSPNMPALDREDNGTIEDADAWVALEKWVDQLVVNGEEDINPTPVGSTTSTCTNANKDDEEQYDALLAVQRHENQEAFEKSLAKEMERLSMEELDRRYGEIHGVAPVIQEEPEFVAQKLEEMDQALNELVQAAATAEEGKSSLSIQYYQKALVEEPLYVQDPKFRLKFLRADSFDAIKAARRLVFYLEKKVYHFGMQTLCREVQMSDLTEKDLKTLQAGSVQQLPFRDRSGRAIFLDPFIFGPKLYSDIRSHYKCLWYMALCAAEDEETQRNGYIHIFWFVDKFLGLDTDANTEFRKYVIESQWWLPIRPVSSVHVCIAMSSGSTEMERKVKEVVSRTVIAVSPKETRYSIKVHKEKSQQDILAKLVTYGIPIQQGFPVSSKTGTITKTASHKQWLAKRTEKEESIQKDGGLSWSLSASHNRIDLPTNQDVLLGKGLVINQHPGNIAYRRMIESMVDDYIRALKTEKAAMTWKVVQTIQQQKGGGRFLKQQSAKSFWWVEATDKEARQKVGKAFVAQASVRKEQLLKQGGGALLDDDVALVTIRAREDGKRIKVFTRSSDR
ncbi:Transfer protein [Seminavis robusta]|uniref:Transfer protein n=1 Tax=Seminavis robusta TaxID=568900 RepID=A0A9N8F0K9_9STRA|nr:Transfer protein [Seminavis robusta]|eukprot:Sro2889_g339520.1 Transfer protein (577) ;mRNA; r:8634-10364